MTNLKVVNSTTLKDWAKAIFTDNNFHMVDVSNKQNTHRKALAMGKIYVGQKTFKLIQNKQMPKGDPIALAEVAALLGVKKTSEIVPLCHPLTVDYSSTKIIQNENDYSLEVFCVVAAFAKTGVEMEAIMGVNAALTTIYDLSKIVNPDLTIDGIRLLIKQGGKSGTWINPHGLPEFLKDLFLNTAIKFTKIMKIKIVMHGNCRDIFHKQALQINFDKKVKVKDIRNKLIEIIKHKHLANKAYISLVKASAFCSQHDEIVNDNYLLNNDKIITIIPPIGGG